MELNLIYFFNINVSENVIIYFSIFSSDGDICVFRRVNDSE